jgi:hypothetical protein
MDNRVRKNRLDGSKRNASRFREELRDYLLTGSDLTDQDKRHLRRWIGVAAHPKWDAIAEDSQRVIGMALHARNLAERTSLELDEKGNSTDPVFNDRKREHVATTEAARAAKLLADFYRSRRRPVNLADLAFGMSSKQHLGKSVTELIEFHVMQEQFLRTEAPLIHSHHVSRQDSGDGKRARTRERGYFSSYMCRVMRELFGKPHHELVADMTAQAFNLFDFDAQGVINAEKTAKQLRVQKKAGKTEAPRR